MEIISYVQRQPKPKNSYAAIKKTLSTLKIQQQERSLKAKNSQNSVTFSFSYPSEGRSFKAGIVHKSVTPKSILISLGQFLTKTGTFLKKNAAKIIISIAAVILIAGSAVAGFIYFDYKQSHTGLIPLDFEQTADLENLNRLMSVFALEGDKDFDSDGNLLDGIAAKQIYSTPVTFDTYKVKSGDTISGIAKKFGLSNISTLISINKITNVRQLAAGKKLKIPSVDGIIYNVKKGDTLDALVRTYNVSLENILDVNELSSETLTVGQELFLPGVGLDKKSLKEAMGELFKMPITAKFYWSSPFGWRDAPLNPGKRSFHGGTDMACPQGTPIYASMSGKIVTAGFSPLYGNYVIIDHSNGYQTLYGHMYKILAKKGQYVDQGAKIGLVGSTGYSTGPHLHFGVYKNGKSTDPMTVLSR